MYTYIDVLFYFTTLFSMSSMYLQSTPNEREAQPIQGEQIFDPNKLAIHRNMRTDISILGKVAADNPASDRNEITT